MLLVVKQGGGVSAVINAYKGSDIWRNWNILWIETHIDKGPLKKISFFLKSFCLYIYKLPQAKLVHIHFSEPMSLMRKLLFFIIAKLFRKKIVVHFHSFSVDTTINSDFSNIYKYVFQGSDFIFVLSKKWKLWIDERWPDLKLKTTVIYNPCDNVENILLHNREKIILYAGTINSRKGYADLLSAFSLIKSKHSKWKIIFAGNGEIKEGIQLAKQLNIQENVEFVGWVSGANKDALFRRASIFCLPSYAEGLPMAVLDAFSYGLPIITTPVGGIPDFLENGKNALIFSPGDINSLANCINTCIIDDSLRFNLSNKSVELSKTTFNKNAIFEKINCIYSSLL
ncbi:glycosyltransferase family 4 protein [Spirosoma foliorum]|uniref:Glycosyltransferase family 4 protein n=1 Tax=Spirosoma foliorum TaxID=2710596 RepID=A0A7G5H0E5_9BACT|nr:glycosyltransferase family 4 protein [Spirosoma foliorum]QMW04587.1 glycosyltransferase family 4 protein [Spirosoma foliorum]